MKTLVFCTSYASSPESWDRREAIWINAHKASNLHFDQLLIVDDGSQYLPDWPDIVVVKEVDIASPAGLNCDAPIVLYTHTKRLGRASVFDFPGWYRSFAFGVLYGASHGFEKIIHIESDAFLVSERIRDYFNRVTSGWLSVWCETYQFPEIAIQVAAGADIENMVAFVTEPYSRMIGQNHELIFPFTHVERLFIGNRYGEMIDHVPKHADYSAQTHNGRQPSFYWWVPQAQQQYCVKRQSVLKLEPPFNSVSFEGGWSASETDGVWMVNLNSVIFLPPFRQTRKMEVDISLYPCIYGDRLEQSLFILLNGFLVNYVSVKRSTTILSSIPFDLLKSEEANELRFIHPDAFSPSDIDGHAESRKLSLFLSKIEFFCSDL